MSTPEADSYAERNLRAGLLDLSRVSLTLGKLRSRITQQIGAGDEARTRNFQLGNLNFRSFIFTTYKTA